MSRLNISRIVQESHNKIYTVLLGGIITRQRSKSARKLANQASRSHAAKHTSSKKGMKGPVLQRLHCLSIYTHIRGDRSAYQI